MDTILNAPSHIWLFGSRVNDDKKGGDIDLFIETQSLCPNRAETICRLYGELVMTLGEQKIDILLKDKNTTEVPILRLFCGVWYHACNIKILSPYTIMIPFHIMKVL